MFCSNACQRALERRQRTDEWLAGANAAVSAHPRHFIRLHLLDEQHGCCAICAQSAVWNGVALSLVLDHIDGDASNNRRDNLRLVCPNCDSQLPTFKSRNRGNGRAWRRERYRDGKSY
jgi:hypothetical protein